VSEAFKELKLDLFQTAYDRILTDALDTLTLEGAVEAQGRAMTTVLNLSRMRNEAGKDLGFVLVFEDLTELMKAQKVATWKEVAQRIAHEIKNPLTPIQLSAQRLRKKFDEKSPDFDNVFEESTGVIISEVGTLKRMVDEFSKYARMPAPQMARQSLHDVVREVVSLYRGAHRDVQFVTDLDEALPFMNFDREQVNRVFVNLLDNAVQAMEQKGRVTIATKHDAKRRRAIVTVADDGPGVNPEDQDKLFLPYFTRKRTGTGLGLAIVQRIIMDHEGQVRVGRNEPKGAVFTFELPT
jgi:two-component system nitrogen regulation sensor histidine kinase NtrY